MISNYIKLAWRVLGRRKFFTFISLFGISFTLGILMVVLSFLQSELGNNAPLGNKDDFVLLDHLRLQRIYYDTITVIDTIYENGIAKYDSFVDYERTGSMQWNSEMNNGIAEEFLSELASVETQTVFNDGASYDVYVNGVKLSLNVLYSDPEYWDIFNHKILEGRSFNETDMDQANQVAVISTKTAEEYFGRGKDIVDEIIELDGKSYTVIGLYKHNGKIMPYVSPGLVIPYSVLDLNKQPTYYHGMFSVIFQKKKNKTAQQVKDEIIEAATHVPMDHPSKPEGYNEIVLRPETYNEMYASGIYYEEDSSKSLRIMKWILGSLLLFFILLPTLNLINLNVSRIMDRSSEIGVRKAFGAHQGNILWQFVIENIVQTFLGGLLGLGLALLLINAINQGGALGDAYLNLNTKFYIYSFIITLIFGILSGLLPAYRMSKLHIVHALKQAKL